MAQHAKQGVRASTSAFPVRPGYGTRGAAVVLWANYVVLTAAPALVLYRYDVAVTPPVTGRKLVQVVRLLLETAALAPHRVGLVTDYKATLLSRTALPAAVTDEAIAVAYRAEGEDAPLPQAEGAAESSQSSRAATTYNVTLQPTNTLSAAPLLEFLTSTDASSMYNDLQPMLQALNIVLNHQAKALPSAASASTSALVSIGSNKTFDLRARSQPLGGGLAALRGFYASVRAASARLLVNVNVSHAAFYEASSLAYTMAEVLRRHGPRRLEAFVARLRIRTTHLPERRNRRGEVLVRTKTVLGLARVDDGHGLQHPPRVSSFAAGPRQVSFRMDAPLGSGSGSAGSASATAAAKGKGKMGKTGKAVRSGPARASVYISVYDFFVQSKGVFISPLFFFLFFF